MITIENLSKAYGKVKALDNVNLQFSAGKIYGIVGENGAGKSTLFRCIAGLEVHDGFIKSPFDPLKNHLGYLETTPFMMSHITGWEYLKLVCSARHIKRSDFGDHNIFDLPLDQYAKSYSTGMKKKLALMALLLCNNDILILDEPFNGVDIQSNMLILEVIKRLRQMGKTILISSHIFATLSDICEEITLLSKGKIKGHYMPDQYRELEAQMTDDVTRTKIDSFPL